ncbi:MAG: ABC transporter ATP-binding protein/permease [Nevskia sp.]|nr:ABC transporter ATP-binding protein/permease [Nevskia sp.]
MTEPVQNASAAPEADEPYRIGLLRQLQLMLQALRASTVGRRLLVLVGAIVVVVVVTAYGQIRLNRWNKPFYDSLSRRDFRDFMVQLGVFFVIVGGLLVLNVAQRWLTEMLKLRLRESLVQDLVGLWMMPRRAFWLARAGAMGVNPDQRMHEDARKLCELSADLGVGLFQASILFTTFAGILWVLSSDFSFRIGGDDYPVPGFMLWAAILYASLGSLLSYWVGRSLIGRNAERYAREADLRSALVHVNEHLDGISLAAGEADERRRVELVLVDVLHATRRLVAGLTNLTWITAGFGWITLVAPILVAAPLFFAGKISFGGLMMAASAFTQAQSSLRWFVDNFSVIADWRATLLRVAGFRHALVAGEELQDTRHRIELAEGEPGRFVIENLEIESRAGRDRLKETDVVVNAGERVLVTAAPGTDRTLLFRALAGLWPRGTGRIAVPPEHILYLPHGTPYLPRGTLREVLAYPMKPEGFGDEACAHALSRGGLERLTPLLDTVRRWNRELSPEEQRSLAFARVVLQAPRWVVVDEALAPLEVEALDRVVDVLAHELAATAIIHIGRAGEGRDALFTRVLHLIKVEDAPAPEAALPPQDPATGP